MSHIGTGGLQAHSIGASYPWTIVGTDIEHELHWYAWNTITGERGETHKHFEQAQTYIALQKLGKAITKKAKTDHAYRIGYIAYTSNCIHGNPFQVSTPSYGAFSDGVHDARAFQILREAIC